MADTEISDLPAASALDGTEVVPVDQASITKRTTTGAIAALAPSQVNADWNASSGVAQILHKPALGTAAGTAATDYATAAQGAKADTAVQPGDLADVATSGSYDDLANKPSIPASASDVGAQPVDADLTAIAALSGTGYPKRTADNTWVLDAGTGGGDSGTGTVTSVELSLPNIFTVSGSPITSAGTLTATLNTQSANVVWAGPSSGGAAAPAFRALVADDIPTLNQSTTGNAATATKLQTARTIAGKSFDGSANITIAASDVGAATSAQGAKADTATQPGDLATVATSGSYTDLANQPSLGTAAAQDTTAFATAAQGAKADSATQPSDLTGFPTISGATALAVVATLPESPDANTLYYTTT